MKEAIQSILYNILQVTVTIVPLGILSKVLKQEEYILFGVGIIMYLIMVWLMLVLHMSIMETSKLKGKIGKTRLSKYLEKRIQGRRSTTKSIEDGRVKLAHKGQEGIDIERVGSYFWRGYRVRVEDPTKVELVETEGIPIEKIQGRIKINGGGYNVETGEPVGVFKTKDKTKYEKGSYYVIGITPQGILKLMYSPEEEEVEGLKYATTFGPHLIVDGVEQQLPSITGIAPRTAIGQREDGSLVFLVVEGRRFSSIGISYRGMQRTMKSLGCINASLLDGGGGSQLSRLNNILLKTDERVIHNIFKVS